MRITADSTSDGVRERHFTVDDVPGVLWSPANTADGRPLILLGHGGGQDRASPGIRARARRYATACGFASAAIDAPGHGNRSRTDEDERFGAEIAARRAAGEPVLPIIVRRNAVLADRAVPEWRAALDAISQFEGSGLGRVGFWGVSLGTAIGIPFVAAEPRITAAVFGLAGRENLAAAAARIAIPVEFLLQWDDELVPRASGLALFDAFASAEKTLHANPGLHASVPGFELDSSQRFFTRHLMSGAGPATATQFGAAARTG